MKIEVGKFYKTRNGKKATIYDTDIDSNFCIHGSINNRYQARWTTKGVAYYFHSIFGGPDDIISEWVEPRPRLKAYLNVDNNTIMMLPLDQITTIYLKRLPHLDEPESQE